MSYTDVGKSAKRMGKVLPRDARKLDPVPPKPPPGVPPHKVRRTYVLTVVSHVLQIHTKVYKYETKQAREQAKKVMQREDAIERRYWENWHRGDESHQTERSIEYTESMLTD